MNKKIFIITLSVLLVLLLCVLCFKHINKQKTNDYSTKEETSIKDVNSSDDIKKEEQVVEEKLNIEESNSKDEEIITNDNSIVENKTIQKSDSSSNQTNTSDIEEKIDNTNTYEEIQEDNNSSNEVIQNDTQPIITTPSYIGVPSPNDFNYSYHHGVIEYNSMSECVNAGIEISLKDTVDIRNTNCFDVVDDHGTILGQYLYITCYSGNCNKYKN